MNKILIGIDPGVKTGLALITRYDKECCSTSIHRAMKKVEKIAFSNNQLDEPLDVLVVVEDARQRKWFGSNSNAKAQGAGSVKRDCKIWEDFLVELKDKNLIQGFSLVHPMRGATKLNHSKFQMMTGITKRTNEHGRDAMMLIWGLR